MSISATQTTRLAVLLLAILGIGLVFWWTAGAQGPASSPDAEFDRTFDHRIELQDSDVLDLRNASGDVSIVSTQGSEARIRVRREVRVAPASLLDFRAWFSDEVDLAPEVRDEILSMIPEPVALDGRVGFDTTDHPSTERVSVSFHYDVHLPLGRSLLIRNGNGSVELAGLDGEIDVVAENGSVKIDAVRGPVRAQTLNGGIFARQIDGPLTAEALNGPILLDAHTMETIHPIQCRSQNGPIRIHVDDDASFEMNASTVNGRVLTRLQIAGERTGAALRSLAGNVGDGGPLFDLHTLNGSVYVNAR